MQISVNHICVNRAGRRALDGLNFAVQTPQLIGIIGANGAGKSTLLRALAGLQETASGDVTFDKTSITSISPEQRARMIGYLPQHASFHWPLSVTSAVALGRFPHRARAVDNDAAIASAMSRAGITHLANRSVDELSGGECMRVHLARLLAGEHTCLIADEPTTSLDPKFQLQVLATLRAEVEQGKAVLISLHDLNLALRYCDRLLLLHDGCLIEDGQPADVLSESNVRSAFDVEIAEGDDARGLFIKPIN